MTAHRGRPTRSMLEEVNRRLAAGEDAKAVAVAVGMTPKAVRRIERRRVAFVAPLSPLPACSENGILGMTNEQIDAAKGEPAATVIAETFPPPPATEPPPSEPTIDGDPLDAAFATPVTPAELVGMAEMVVGTVDSGLAAIFGGPPPQGLTDGQKGFLKVFHKRIARAIEDLGAMDKLGPKETLFVTLIVLVAPRGFQRVTGYYRRKRDAGGPLPRGTEDGEDGRGDRVVPGAGAVA